MFVQDFGRTEYFSGFFLGKSLEVINPPVCQSVRRYSGMFVHYKRNSLYCT